MDWFCGQALLHYYRERKVIERFKRRRVNKVLDLNDFPKDRIEQLKKVPIAQQKQFVADRFDLDIEDEDDKKIIDDIVEQFRSKKDIIEFQITEIESFPDIVVKRNPHAFQSISHDPSFMISLSIS